MQKIVGAMMLIKSIFRLSSSVIGYVLGLLIYLFPLSIFADSSELLKDINTASGTLNPDINSAQLEIQMVSHNGVTYFAGTDSGNGIELWRTDGTTSGTYMIKDISPGSASSTPTNFAVLDEAIYFSAQDETHGRELWKTDGTQAGTTLVKDINPGSSPSLPAYLTSVNGLLLFKAYTSENGNELWRSDGTEAGTQIVKDLRENDSSNPMRFTVYKNDLYFGATAKIPGSISPVNSLWKSDGTTEGTVSIKGIYPSTEIISPAEYGELDGILYISTYQGLWRTDGTEAGTQFVKAISPTGSYAPRYLTAANGLLFFVGDDGSHGEELWRSDGSESGTWMVKDIRAGAKASLPSNFVEHGGLLYFRAFTEQNGNELWKTDGTSQGTELVVDAVPGAGGSNAAAMVLNDSLYFQAGDADDKAWLWKTDGTSAGSSKVTSLSAGVYEHYNHVGYPHKFVVNDRLYFTVHYHYGVRALWTTDGTADGTRTLMPPFSASAFERNPGMAYPANFTKIGNDIFFTANDGERGTELWKTDGTYAGTYMVKDIAPGPDSSQPTQLVAMDGILYFFAIAVTTGHYEELWRSDGTESGTYMVRDIWPGDPGSTPDYLTVYNNKLYFEATESPSSRDQLWQSDGTESGTVPLNSLVSMPDISRPWYMTVFNNALYFSAVNNASAGLYKFDGNGVQLVKEFADGAIGEFDSVHQQLVEVNNLLFFKVNLGMQGHQLWRSDGTEQGTYFLRVINPQYDWMWGSFYDGQLTAVGNELYFLTENIDGVRELWKTDGVKSNTVQLAVFDGDFYPSTEISDLTAVGDKLYFRGYSYDHGYELWVSDGTETGTKMFKDIAPGPRSSGIASLADIDGVLYFAASNENGNEIWKTDGSEQGTTMVADVNPGLSSSSPKDFLKIEQGILHTAYTAVEGRELRLLLADPVPAPLPPTQNHAPQLSTIEDQAIEQGSIVEFLITSSDSDGDSITISATNLPSGAVLTDHGNGSADFSWNTADVPAGVLQINFISSDGELEDSQLVSFTIQGSSEVLPVPEPIEPTPAVPEPEEEDNSTSPEPDLDNKVDNDKSDTGSFGLLLLLMGLICLVRECNRQFHQTRFL